MTTVVLVRHGESRWNAEGRLQGQGGTSLSALGEGQAKITADYLCRRFPSATGIRSDLERVAQTAQPWEAQAGAKTEVDVRWREIDVGTWSGLTWDEVAQRDPETLAAWRGGSDVRRGGGETFAELRQRTFEALQSLAGRDATVIVFTSGGCIRLGVAAVLGLPLMGERVLGPAANCSVTELVLDADQATLVAYNGREHLTGI